MYNALQFDLPIINYKTVLTNFISRSSVSTRYTPFYEWALDSNCHKTYNINITYIILYRYTDCLRLSNIRCTRKDGIVGVTKGPYIRGRGAILRIDNFFLHAHRVVSISTNHHRCSLSIWYYTFIGAVDDGDWSISK